jgi:23S rRNA pseudouridine1911/1915/1917 synthase
MRLDIFASQKLGTSREKAKKLILNGKITVNGVMQKVPKFETNEADEIVCSQEIVQILNEILPNFGVELKVIFEDAHILVINKQKGLMVHEGASENFHTLVNILVARFGAEFLAVGSSFRPGIVHRLDKNTTGLMVVAKTQEAFEVLTKMIQEHDFTRKYLAVCNGSPRLQAGMIKVNIDIDHSDRTKRKAVQFGGKEAVTHYRLLDSRSGFSLIECKLETGRTHQIRVHLSHIGIPIVGDDSYNSRHGLQVKSKELAEFSSQILHAYHLEFQHPITKERLAFIEKKEFLDSIEYFNFMPVF